MPRIRIITSENLKALDEYQLAGLFFVIDGKIYVDGTASPARHETHQHFFEKIKEEHPEVNKKYSNYSYLYFPRGALIRDDETGKVMFGAPREMSESQKQKVLSMYRYPADTQYDFVNDDTHYSLPYITNRISRAVGWSQDMKDDEIEFVTEFFSSQLSQL